MYARLAEHGIVLDPDGIPEKPEDTPVGMVGAQDLGGVIELKQMYVLPGYRRQSVGTLLVRTLINIVEWRMSEPSRSD